MHLFHRSKRAMSFSSRPSCNEAICGINYVTRVPQGVASGLGKTPLTGTGHESTAAMGDAFPVEALGSFQAIHAVGGIVETTFAGIALWNTAKALSKRAEINARFERSQQTLGHALNVWRSAEPDPLRAQAVCNAARQVQEARSAKAKFHTAASRLPEQIIDAARYTVVSWTSRVFSVLKLAFKAASWIALAASIVGIVGSVFQVLSGAFKWHSSNKSIESAKRSLKQLDNAQPTGEPHAPLCKHLLDHIHTRRASELQKARNKRTRARIETIAGIFAAVFGALALAFPPLGFVAIAAGLLYAGYRVYLGIQSWVSTRASQKHEQAMREAAADGGNTANNPYRAIRRLIEQVQQNSATWLRDFLARLGTPVADREAVFLLIRTNELEQAGHTLEQLFFETK